MVKVYARVCSITIVLWILFLVVSCKGPTVESPLPPSPTPPGSETPLSFPSAELRAAWITTVWGIDWPLGKYSAEEQKALFREYITILKELNMNVAFVQIRGMGDAFYDSPYEPWSQSITGSRGKDPGYDLLQFMIETTHDAGLEFHAWINPYRIATRSRGDVPYPPLHSSIDPSWVVSHEKIQIYNPALPEVRKRLADIVKDLLLKYDVDGVHFDDYFYPSSSQAGSMVSDRADYEKYGKKFASVEDFRRDNVTQVIKLVSQTIQATKPHVRFSISPAPNQEMNFDQLFADVSLWCREGYMDFVIPQLYQEIGNRYNDFQKNMYWWTQYRGQCNVMVGHALYKFGDPMQASSFGSNQELRKQLELTRKDQRVQGNVFYSMVYLRKNPVRILEVIRSFYDTPALIPSSKSQEARFAKPLPPLVKVSGNTINWQSEKGLRYAVFYFPNKGAIGKLLSITSSDSFPMIHKGEYRVVAVNNVNLQSLPSEGVSYK